MLWRGMIVSTQPTMPLTLPAPMIMCTYVLCCPLLPAHHQVRMVEALPSCLHVTLPAADYVYCRVPLLARCA
jgi:hypothetical protein